MSNKLLVHGFIRVYVEQKYLLTYDIPHGIKNVCCNFCGYCYELFHTNDKDLKITLTEQGTNLAMTNTNYSWSRAYSIHPIDLKQDNMTYEWIFKINRLSVSALVIGISGNGLHENFFQLIGIGTVCSDISDTRIRHCKIVSGDILRIELCLYDTDKSYMKFDKNEQDYGKLFINEIPRDDTQQFRFFLELLKNGDNITLLSFNTAYL